jgi:hypothetical protein
MNQQQRAVMQQALEALIYASSYCDTYPEIESLRQLLEQPMQEPVLQEIEQYRMQMAGISTAALGYWKEDDGIHPDYDTPALRDVAKLYAKYAATYTTPPAQLAVPLTDKQADLLINGRGDKGDDDYVEPTGDGFGLTDEDLVRLIRRVEAHHGIGAKP